MRNKTLTLLVLCLIAVSCSKGHDEPVVSITPALLSAPTCGDTSDDGKFEAWNATEDSLIFPSSAHRTMPAGVYQPGYLQKMSLPTARIASADPSFTIHATYDTGRFWTTEFLLVNRATGLIEGRAYSDRSGKPSGYPITEKLVLSGSTALTPGCHRLYYWGGQATGPVHTSPNQVLADTIDVFFKGHFDVEVY